MNNGLYISVLALLSSLPFSQQVQASSDESSCPWGEAGCVFESFPTLNTSNDTRDNLLRLLRERNGIPLHQQQVPVDLTRNRNFYFGAHPDGWYSEMQKTQTEPAYLAPSPVIAPLKALGLDELSGSYSDTDTDSLDNRFVSMTPESDANFFNALLTDKNLTQEQRQSLAKAKINGVGSTDSQAVIDVLSFPDGSDAQQFKLYLLAASDFYAGHYEQAKKKWLSLKDSSQSWLSETSSYMLMRNALNNSSQNAEGEYGDFDVKKIDQGSALEALKWADGYLQQWPAGQYAASTLGLKRRINWYLQNWDELAKLSEQALVKTRDPEALSILIAETDSKLLSKDMTWNSGYFLNAPDSPLLTFIQTLRLMRDTECKGHQPCVDEDYLTQIKPVFEAPKTLPYWEYLELMLKYQKKDYSAVISQIKPVAILPQDDILVFSRQVLYGKALMAAKKWGNAREHWSMLLHSTQNIEQQQFLQSELAATFVLSGKTEDVFDSSSQVTSLRYRSFILKTRASPELLRQQVNNAPNDEERTIALHSLLMHDLITAHYVDWLADKNLAGHISHPVIGEDFSDVDLSVFEWSGENTEEGYSCRSLEKIVEVLSKNGTDGHALNCLGEFIRTTDAKINLLNDGNGNADLSEAVLGRDADALTQPSRQDYYQTVMTDPKSEPEDKSYALYRAVMCYSPSGNNGCGGEGVDKLKRKGWFTQLKMEYPGSQWAKELQYYW